jgi:hypothetical protein
MTQIPTNRRRWLPVGLLTALMLITASAVVIGLRVQRRHRAGLEITNEVDHLIGVVQGKKRMGLKLDRRIQAARRLGEIGPQAGKALPALEGLSVDRDEYTAASAKDAIARIKQ